LPGSELVEEGLTSRDFDLLIVSGCSVKNRIGNKKIENLSVKTINLDHHPDNTNFADINVVDHTKSSVAELAYDLFLSCGWKLTPEASTCLLTGIFTDTGSFMHSNTVSSTFSAAADLLIHGARLTTIAKKTFQGKNLEVLKAWGKALENAYFDEKKQIIYSVVTDPDLKNLGELPAAAFDGLVETLNKVPQAKFALFLRQEGNVIKGSLRSDPHKGVDVSQIAHVFGGGGHKWASGFSVVGKLTKDLSGNWQIVS
jgi:phosphoesterase RecJ-like protein